MVESIVLERGMKRHQKFIQKIFVDVTRSVELEEKDDLAMTLDELLEHIFDSEE